jgi:hypothetical protein
MLNQIYRVLQESGDHARGLKSSTIRENNTIVIQEFQWSTKLKPESNVMMSRNVCSVVPHPTLETDNVNIVACRPVARQRKRKKQLYNHRC